MITKIRKRDGREDHFIPERITRAIFLAATQVAKEEGTEADYSTAEYLTDRVVSLLNREYKDAIPSVEQVQDAVVKVLIETGHAKTSEKYILYRAERTNIRNMKTRLMRSIKEITFSDSNESDLKRDNANIDGNTAMGTMLQYGSAVSKEFCMSQVMNPEHALLHENGDIQHPPQQGEIERAKLIQRVFAYIHRPPCIYDKEENRHRLGDNRGDRRSLDTHPRETRMSENQ